MTRARKLPTALRMAMFLAVLAVMVLAGVSNLLIRQNPGLATLLNPVNTEARIAWLERTLRELAGKQPSARQLDELESAARAIIRLSPEDARGYSLLGAVFYLRADRAAAYALFEKALRKGPTEHNALLHLLQRDIRQGDLARAVERLDALLRRWPEDFDRLKPVLKALVAIPAGQDLLRNTLGRHPPWRNAALRFLLDEGGAPGRYFIQNMLLREAAGPTPPPEWNINHAIGALVKAGDLATAYRTFVFTLNAQQRKVLGFVFDSRFTTDLRRRLFSWQIHPQPGVEITAPHYAEGEGRSGLSLQFMDAPVKLGNIRQLLHLPPGSYELRVRASARSLVAPKGLFWTIHCYRGGGELLRLQVPEGSYDGRTLQAEFTVPASCKGQYLRLVTSLLAPSWSARYRGEIIFHEVAVHRRDWP